MSLSISLIYPHQLFSQHPALDLAREIYLIEDPLFFGNDPHWPLLVHKQKLMLHRASMQAYAAELISQGYRVHVIECPEGTQIDSPKLLTIHLPPALSEIHYADVSDDVLDRRIQRFAKAQNILLTSYASPHFISPCDFLETQIARKKKPFMASFYEAQRKRTGILIDQEENPFGGKWSFDTENRSKLPKAHTPPEEPFCSANSYTEEAKRYVERKFPHHLGSTKNFRWPVTRAEAAMWLKQFMDQRLELFGQYEDAISIKHSTIYHSAITPMLNIGLIDTKSVIHQALARQTEVPLNSLEGFIRQVIGWREFMHGIYRHRGVNIRTQNFWSFERKIPASFYDGTTGIPPIDRVIRQLLTDGWCHHIERLMILGNFMLLCRFHPDEVYRWFMEMFVDSYDWVMVPNIYGMSQFADGGTFTTKPYISGSNYVLKMSDEPKGDWCKIWDGLFWTFIADHHAFFLKNPRLSMMARSWEKMSPEKQEAHRESAGAFLGKI